ncbi:MAG TPA: SPASM domain-containing protein [Chryseosolibacter sp.]
MIGGFRDGINLISKTTWKRAFNAACIVRSYQASKSTKRADINGLPISISIEPTTSCNLRCPECPSGLRSFTRPTGMLDPQLYTKVIDELAPTLSYLTFYFQGEPYLHPQFIDMVEYASSKGIYTATSTNAHFLNADAAHRTIQSGLDRLIISIDGTTQEAYQSYRIGGSLDKVVEGTKNIISAKKRLRSTTPHVIFQFLVVGPNEHQVPEVYRMAKDLGVDQVVLKTAQIYDYENGSPLIPKQDRYSRYQKNPDGTWSIKNKMDDHCWKMWHSCVVTWDGKVVPCCFDKDAHFVLGDLRNNSFSNVWNGDPYKAFRTSLLVSRSEIEMCRNCTEGSRVFA